MTNNDIILLSKLIEEWFEEFGKEFGNKNFLSRNKVAAVLKQKLKELGHWKKKGEWQVSDKSKNNLKPRITALRCRACNSLIKEIKEGHYSCPDLFCDGVKKDLPNSNK